MEENEEKNVVHSPLEEGAIQPQVAGQDHRENIVASDTALENETDLEAIHPKTKEEMAQNEEEKGPDCPPKDLPPIPEKNEEKNGVNSYQIKKELVKNLKAIEALLRQTIESKMEAPQAHELSINKDQMKELVKSLKAIEALLRQTVESKMEVPQAQELSINKDQMKELLKTLKGIGSKGETQPHPDLKDIIEEIRILKGDQRMLTMAVWGETFNSSRLEERFETKDEMRKVREDFESLKNENRVVFDDLRAKLRQVRADLRQSSIEEKLIKNISCFSSRLPTLLGFLTVIFTMLVKCEVKWILIYILYASVAAVLLHAALTSYRFWQVSKTFNEWKANLNGTPEQIDVSFWTIVWPFLMEFVVLLIYSLLCAGFVYYYITNEKCVGEDDKAPVSSPVSSPSFRPPEHKEQDWSNVYLEDLLEYAT